jgi:hypothetical protein
MAEQTGCLQPIWPAWSGCGNLSEEELTANRNTQPEDTARYKFRDDEYYQTKDFNLSDIGVPVLSVANWVSLFPSIASHAGYCN